MSETATPATLSDVLAGARSLLVTVGVCDEPHVDFSGKAPFLLGERHLREEGTPPRIVVVREDGQDGPALATGARQVGGITERVRFYIWGAETTDDIDRMRAAELLWHRVVNALKASAAGRLVGKPAQRERGTNVVTYGEELQRVLEYTYGVPEDADIWAAAYAANPSPVAPPRPDQPQGDTGATFSTDTVTLTNARP